MSLEEKLFRELQQKEAQGGEEREIGLHEYKHKTKGKESQVQEPLIPGW